VGLFRGRATKDREEAAEPLKEQARTVEAPAEVVRGEVKFEARPNPDNPGWGRTVGQEIGKAREDRASPEGERAWPPRPGTCSPISAARSPPGQPARTASARERSGVSCNRRRLACSRHGAL